jgi:hypothetical protein
VRAQPLRQSVGHGGGLGLLVVLAFVLVRGFAFAAETLPQPFQRAQRLGLGFAQQPAMNHGLPVAVDGDDGTGCGLHVGRIVLQAIFQRLQLLAQAFAFFLQGIGLFLVLVVQRGIHGGQFVQLGLQLLDALRFALVRTRRSLGARWKACRSAWVTPGVASTHAQPSAFTSAAIPASLSCASRSSSAASVRYTPASPSANRSRRMPPPACS